MSTGEPQVSSSEVHAYADRELPQDRSAEVEAWLKDNEDARGLVEDVRRINEALQSFYGPIASEPVPGRLLQASERRSTFAMAWRRAAAAVVLLAVGALAGWFGRDVAEQGDKVIRALANESFSAHQVFVVEVRHPVEVAADQEQHLVRWLTKRLGAEVRAPNLRGKSYELVGGRLLSADAGPAAQFMYETREGRRLTLYVRQNAEGGETAFRFKQAGNLSGFYWLEGPLAYAIVAELPREELLDVATVIYEQLE